MKKVTTFIWITFISFIISHSPVYAEGQRVGVIGSGGSGLTTTWLLDQDYDVTLFEIQDRLGGHANSIEVEVDGQLVPIEAGFEFISQTQFPHFYNLLKNILQVPLHEYTLVTTFYRTTDDDALILPPIHDGIIEWESMQPHDIFTMGQFDYLLSKSERLIAIENVGISFEDFVESFSFNKSFKNEFLYPFVAAGWGVSKEDIKKFSAYDALKYVVKGKDAPNYQWIEIVGGTQKYIKALASELQNTVIKLSSKITQITYDNGIYTVMEEDGTQSQFDHLVIATNAMEAAKLLKDIPERLDLRSMLSQIEYFKTTIAIHGDERFMPRDKRDWTVVNVRYDGTNSATTVHKKWLSETPIFKSWLTFDVRSPEDNGDPMPEPLYDLVQYDHPKADLKYFQVQKAIGMIQGNHNLWFAGNYTHDNDSHESAIVSAIKIAKKLAPESARLAQITNLNP